MKASGACLFVFGDGAERNQFRKRADSYYFFSLLNSEGAQSILLRFVGEEVEAQRGGDLPEVTVQLVAELVAGLGCLPPTLWPPLVSGCFLVLRLKRSLQWTVSGQREGDEEPPSARAAASPPRGCRFSQRRAWSDWSSQRHLQGDMKPDEPFHVL